MFTADLSDMFIACAISNTPRFKRRKELADQFFKRVAATGIDVVICELALGDRQFVYQSGQFGSNFYVLPVRTIEEFWHKENQIRLAIQHGRRNLKGKKRVAWIDADCAPVGRSFTDWFKETWHELQHYKFVQMWEWLQSLDYNQAPLGLAAPSFVSNYIKFGTPYPDETHKAAYPLRWGSPGLAWAANLDAYDELGELPDAGVSGAGDWYLAHMLCTGLDIPSLDRYTPGYRNYWLEYQKRAERWIKRDVGYVKGLYTHFFHGPIKKRSYGTRENILLDNNFDPTTDLKRDSQGLWQLETHDNRTIAIRDGLRQYAKSRNEDSIDTDQKTGPY
jgi:hypothetical protein